MKYNKMEYIPPKPTSKDVFIYVCMGIMGGLFIWFGYITLSGPDEFMGYFIICTGAFIDGCVILAFYSMRFCWPPYRLSQDGIELRRLGLIPWQDIRCVECRKWFSRYGESLTMVINLRSMDFLKRNNVNTLTAASTARKKRVLIAPGKGGYSEFVRFTAKFCREQTSFRVYTVNSLLRQDEYEMMYPIYRRNDWM